MNRIAWPLAGVCLMVFGSLAGCSSSEDSPSPPADVPAEAAVAETGDETNAPDAPEPGDASEPDAGDDASADTSTPDADAPAEAGPDSSDDVALEAATDSAADVAPGCVPLDGLGAVACTCNLLEDGVWSSSTPFLFMDSVDLGTTGWDPTQLTAGGQKIVADGNLGGSSVESEALAYDVLARCEFATLLKSEGEIDYTDAGGKKTDELVLIDSRKVGVSVTRAYHYPPTEPCTVAEAQTLLTKKLEDVPLSAANAVPADAWERSMLAVVAVNQQCADTYVSVWNQLDATLRADTIIFVMVTDGDDSAIY